MKVLSKIGDLVTEIVVDIFCQVPGRINFQVPRKLHYGFRFVGDDHMQEGVCIPAVLKDKIF